MIVELLVIATLILNVFFVFKFVARDYLSPLSIFCCFYFLDYVVRGAILLFGFDELSRSALVREDPQSLVLRVLGLSAIGFNAVALGYVIAGRKVLFAGLGKYLQSRQVAFKRVSIIGVLLASAVLLQFAVLLSSSGSVSALMYLARREGLYDGASILKVLPTFVSYVASCTIVLTWGVRTPGARRARRAGYLALAATILYFLSTAERSELIYPVLLAIIGLHYAGVRLSLPRFSSFAIIAIMVLTVLGTVRGQFLSSIKTEGVASFNASSISEADWGKGLASQLTKGLNLNTFDHFAILTQDFDHSNFLLGEHFLKGIVAPVPRAIWSGKPQSITPGSWFNQYYYGSTESGMPFGPMGEWWVNFGFSGVMVGMFLTGMLLKALTVWVKRFGPESRFAAFLVAIVAVTLVPKGIGALMPVQIVQTLLPLMLLGFLITHSPRQLFPPKFLMPGASPRNDSSV